MRKGPSYTWDLPIPVQKCSLSANPPNAYPHSKKLQTIEVTSVSKCQPKEDFHFKDLEQSKAPAQPEGPETDELQCWASSYTSSHLQKLRLEAGSLQTRIHDLSRVVGGSSDDKGVGALRVHSALLSAEVGALETVLETTSNQSSEQAVWTAMQQALKKQHRIELMTLRTAAALSGHQIGLLSSSSEASDTSYASTATSPQSGSIVPDKSSDVEGAQSSTQESTTIDDDNSDRNADSSVEVVNLSSDEEDLSDCSPWHTEISYSPKLVAPGEIAVPLPCWAALPLPRGPVQTPPSPKADASPSAFKAVLGCDADSLKSTDSRTTPDHLTCNSRNNPNAVPFTPDSTSEDISHLMLQMVGVRKGHNERCAAKMAAQMKFFEFR